MTPDDLEVFTARLVEVGELFDADLTSSKQLLYFEALSDLDLDVVIPGLRESTRRFKFMPRPAEIRTLILGDDEDAAEVAWMAFKAAAKRAGAYASLVTADAALGDAILAVFQSWPQACSLDLTPEMWSSKRKEFGRVYRVCRSRGTTGARYLPGITEQQNAGVSEWNKYNAVYQIEGESIMPLSLEAATAAKQQIAAQAGFQRIGETTRPRLALVTREEGA